MFTMSVKRYCLDLEKRYICALRSTPEQNKAALSMIEMDATDLQAAYEAGNSRIRELQIKENSIGKLSASNVAYEKKIAWYARVQCAQGM